MKLASVVVALGLAIGAVTHALAASDIPVHSVNDTLRNKLPKEILDSGIITVVNATSTPPFEMLDEKGQLAGASVDLANAVSELLGVKFHHEVVTGFPAILMGINSGRYQLTMGPAGDFPDRQVSNDFVDWVQEHVVFAVPKGNPKAINSMAEACGVRVAVFAGGAAEKAAKRQAETCKSNNKPELEVQTYADEPAAVLAVRASRADAFFTSQTVLRHFVKGSNGALEIAGTGSDNGFPHLYQGAVVAKNSPVGPVLLAAMEELFNDGTYAAIMKKWELESNMIPRPGINMAGSGAGK